MTIFVANRWMTARHPGMQVGARVLAAVRAQLSAADVSLTLEIHPATPRPVSDRVQAIYWSMFFRLMDQALSVQSLHEAP